MVPTDREECRGEVNIMTMDNEKPTPETAVESLREAIRLGLEGESIEYLYEEFLQARPKLTPESQLFG